MTVTVEMLRQRLVLVDAMTPVNLVTGDQDLERMLEHADRERILQLTSIRIRGGDAPRLELVISFVDPRHERHWFDVTELRLRMRSLSGIDLVVPKPGHHILEHLGGSWLRIANACPNTTERGAKEFTFEIALEE